MEALVGYEFIIGLVVLYLLFLLLEKFKIVNMKPLRAINDKFTNGFSDDYNSLKYGGWKAIKRYRWHLHALVGSATTFSMLMLESVNRLGFLSKFMLIGATAFLIQVAYELYMEKTKQIEPDFSDSRFGMYGALITVILTSIISTIFTLSPLVCGIIVGILLGFTYYLVKIKKH